MRLHSKDCSRREDLCRQGSGQVSGTRLESARGLRVGEKGKDRLRLDLVSRILLLRRSRTSGLNRTRNWEMMRRMRRRRRRLNVSGGDVGDVVGDVGDDAARTNDDFDCCGDDDDYDLSLRSHC